MNIDRTLSRISLAFAGALALVAAAPAAAQEMDARLLPWLGCWTPAAEGTGLDLVCVQPAQQPGAMEIVRIADGQPAGREVIWTDGRRHETAREACTGWEEGSLSEDGRRIFLRGAFTCDGVTQETSGVVAMASAAAWIDVRTAGQGSDQVAWVQRYVAATAEASAEAGYGDLLRDRAWVVGNARVAASAPLDADDVIEASERVPAEAVKALLAEKRDGLDLDAATLVRMADAGVDEGVIDVAVAVSFPDRFQLASGGEPQVASALDDGSLRRRWVGSPAYYDPYFMPWSLRYGRGWYGYDPYGYGYGYGYGGLGYGYGYPYGYRPTVVVVTPSSEPAAQHGRVVNGRGYARGGSRSSGGSSDSYVPARSGASGSSGATAGSSSGTRSGSSGAASTGRTAKRRGGGL